MKKLFASGYWVSTAVLLALPLAAGAQAPSVNRIFELLQRLFNFALILIFSIATIYFLWGLVQYILQSGDETAQKKAKQHMLYGIIAVAVMLAFWALILVIVNYFELGQRSAPTIPSLPSPAVPGFTPSG